ncbi:thioredoxin [Bacteroides sp.]
MKSMKTLTAIFALTLTFAATACAGNKDNNSNNPQKEQSEMTVTALTKADFLKKVYNYEANPNEWKFEGSRPAIIDFYATWCGPCKVMSPILDGISKDYAGKIDVYKIDVDKESELAGAFGIQSIPTLLMIPAKGDPKILQGAMPKDQLTKVVDDFLLK